MVRSEKSAVANQLTRFEVGSLYIYILNLPSMEYDGFSNHPFRVEWGFGDFRLPSNRRENEGFPPSDGG